MISCSLRHSVGTTISHGKTFSRATIGMEVTTRSTVQACISNNTGFRSYEASIFCGHDGQLTSVHSLSNVVITFTNKLDVHSRQQKGAERLTGTSIEFDVELTLESLITVSPGDISRKHGADTAIRVLDVELDTGASFIVRNDLDNLRCFDDFAIQIGAESAYVHDLILHLTICSSEEGTILSGIRDAAEEGIQVHSLGLGDALLLRLALAQQISTSDQIFKLGVTKVGH
mmetsp:Transcript_8072/g.11974  ORF Transcript_8072/g.11974 Transcript_8072/m.11974 type:complete len:230 (+) Transcript_8072:521-1210(+)